MRSTIAISRSWTIAPDLFDKPVVPQLSKAFLAAPTNWWAVAALHGQIIGKCTALLHLLPDKKVELYIDEIDGIEKWRRNGIARAQ
ncbi:hypothetical protein [Parasphingorhabdus sp.]|uniref:hypothetical protein n=1 Tax=Parasphingorhabdus sp. TaxID=2709688 RepID=UPI003592F4D9